MHAQIVQLCMFSRAIHDLQHRVVMVNSFLHISVHQRWISLRIWI